MLSIKLLLTGTSPLVMHNAQLADPSNSFTREIGKITSKGKDMTDADRLEVARLEFAGGLYVGKQGIVVPAANISRCIARAAAAKRKGKQVERAMLPTAIEFPLIYKGPRDPTGLWAEPQFHYSTLVGVNRGKVVRMRPSFPQWSLESEWQLQTSVLNLRSFVEFAELAGLSEGLGDNRRNAYGRFTAEVEEIKTNARPLQTKAA